MLTHWKFYLRSITNAIIDARIHSAGMTEDEAVALMVDGGFQEEAEARAKYDRARLSSTQLSTYFAGSMEMWAIELEARRRAAAAVGAIRAARSCREPRVPGGFGETPGLPLPRPPRGRHRPRRAADVAAPADPVRLSRSCRAWSPRLGSPGVRRPSSGFGAPARGSPSAGARRRGREREQPVDAIAGGLRGRGQPTGLNRRIGAARQRSIASSADGPARRAPRTGRDRATRRLPRC